MSITEKELFDRLVQLETEKLTLLADIKQLKKDAAYDEDFNPDGLSKDDIKLVAKAAVLRAKENFSEMKEGVLAVIDKYEQMVGDDE